MDIIGPLPRGKGGYKYALTLICMASRWPEVYPLKKPDTDHVAQALIDFISRNGIPMKLLTDQGTQFMAEALKKACKMLCITHIVTSPYRPQGNSMLERFHGTLKPILSKACDSRLDWVSFLPVALSAIRNIPCRSTGISPAELVFGRSPRSFLDILFEGWTNPTFSKVNVSEWVQRFQSTLEVLRDKALLADTMARKKRSASLNKHASNRSYEPGSLVLTRIPGTRASLSASWEGPFEVVSCLNKVNYDIKDPNSNRTKTVHLNNIRTYDTRTQSINKPIQPLIVRSACFVAEEDQTLTKIVNKPSYNLKQSCENFSQRQLNDMLHGNDDVFDIVPPFSIIRDETKNPVNKPPYQVPLHLRSFVNDEVEKLLSQNIMEPSHSHSWCSPIVPVKKPDGTVTLCVDYRALNSVTPLDRHHIPTLSTLLQDLGKSTVLSKRDLTSGFYQITVDPDSRDFTTFLAPRGKFRFVRMPFGLKNAPSHFQRAMD